MANENVKITIQEVNTTTPLGSGTSTDVVYVPGLVKADGDNFVSTKNKPVLCTDLSTFELHFGDSPYELTESDKSGYSDFTDVKYDLSYIYAKELINAGLSVYYEAIVNEGAALDSETTLAAYTAAQEAYNNALTDVTTKEKAHKTAYNNYAKDDKEDADKTAQLAQALAQSDVDLHKAEDVLATKLQLRDDAKAAYDAAVASVSKLAYFYEVLPQRLENITDKGEYSIKYITSGGYPTYRNITDPTDNTIADALVAAAYDRQDAVALVDHINDRTLPLSIADDTSIYHSVNSHNWSNGTFGAMFTPWGTYSCVTMPTSGASQTMPASFGYLLCVANAIKTSPNWLAMAGIARGQVPAIQKLSPIKRLSNVIAEDYQPKYGKENNCISVNAITNVAPYGLTIWGNRTLEVVPEKGTTALNFLNTRNMVSDIKKLAHTTAKSLMFEQDSDVLWLKFKSGVSPLLDQLKSGYGISNYKIIRNNTKYNGQALTRGEISAVIKIYPLYAVEYFEITVVIADDDVTVS